MLELLLAPAVACVVLVGIHCWLGIHVLLREVIFVDLALAQVAAAGAALAVLLHLDHEGPAASWLSLGSALLAAALFAVARFRDRRVPQEAIIGIVYAVASAAVVLFVSHSPLDRDEVEQMLVGRLLFVDWPEILSALWTYLGVAAVHLLCRRPLLRLARGEEIPGARWWDFLFYATFALVVTHSVRMAGVLLVFSFLVVPACCAAVFVGGIGARLLLGWLFGLLGSGLGLWASAAFDLPTGAAVVVALGSVFALAAALGRLRTRTGTAAGNP